MKNKLLIILLLVSISVNIFTFFGKSENKDDGFIFSYKRARKAYNLPLKQSASCDFKNDMSVTYPESNIQTEDRNIKFQMNKNYQPINIAFIDLDTDNPKMRGNGGQSDLVKIIDNEEVVTVIERDPISFGTLQSFSIFKDTGVGIWTKQYNLAAKIPFGLVSMGYCD